MLRASLPMYALTQMRAANAAFWDALAALLRAEGVSDVPNALDAERPPVPERIEDDVLFTQTCGFPLQTLYAKQHRLLAVPTYDAPGCGPGTHCAFVIARRDAGISGIEALRGRTFAVNSLHSNSGMNLPRLLFAPLAAGRPFFSDIVLTGSHGASLAAVRFGRAAGASVDCLTWAFLERYAPALAEGLHVIGRTASSPAIPFVTSVRTPSETIAALERCLESLFARPEYAVIREPLLLKRIGPADPAVYAGIMHYEAQARAMGYPVLV